MKKYCVIDLKAVLYNIDHSSQGVINEYRQNRFLSNHGLFTIVRIPQMCHTLSGQLQNTNFLMLGPIFMHGIRAVNISRKPARYRSMFKIRAEQVVPHGYSWQNCSGHVSRCKRKPGLANLRRLRSNTNSHCQRTIRKRRVEFRIRTNYLCLRYHHYRSLPGIISLGCILQGKSSRQTAYIDGHTGFYPFFRRDNSWENLRCQNSRSSCPGTGFFLHYGSWLPRLSTPVYSQSISVVFCNPLQKEPTIQKSLFSRYQQRQRSQVRSNNSINRCLYTQILPRQTQTHCLSRYRNRQTIDFFDQQFYTASINDCSTLQTALAV